MIKLDWDSSFFDLSISSSFHEVITEDILYQSKNKMNEQLIDLCYLQSSNPIPNVLLDTYPIEHKSQKIQFQKLVYTLSEHQNTYIKSIPHQVRSLKTYIILLDNLAITPDLS